jgi:hypothetical protein
MNITVNIERLILEGLPIAASQGPLVQAALEAELGRMLAADGLAASLLAGGARPTLPASAIQVGSGSDPAALGRQIAQALYGGIGAAGQGDRVTG